MKTEVREYFKPDSSKATLTNYSLVNKQESNVDGIPTERYTFAKDNVLMSETERLVGSQQAIVQEVFNGVPSIPAGYSIALKETTDAIGIPVQRFTFLKDNVVLSETEDKVGSQLSLVKEVFNGTPSTPSGYSIANEQVSDVDGIPTRRFTFLKDNAVLSRNIETKNGGKLIIETVEVFNGTPTAETSSAVKIGDEKSNVDGIPTRRFRFAKGEGQISVQKRPAEPQLGNCQYITVRSIGTAVTGAGVLISESETESDGYIAYEKVTLDGTIAGNKQTYKDVTEVTVAGTVNCTEVNKSSGNISGSIAVTQVTPPRTKQLVATVTVDVTATPPTTAALAYDLGNISCSVTTISMSENFRGTDVFTTASGNTRFSGQRKAADMSASISTYPSCYLTSSSGSGDFTYDSSFENTSTSPTSIVTQAQVSTTSTFTDGTGSTSNSSATTGVIRRNSRPILTTLAGVTYYEVITWTV